LLPALYCASLRPVSELKKARNLLKVKHLKHYFKYPEVFHSPVEKPVENFSGGEQKKGQEGEFTTSSAASLKKMLERDSGEWSYQFVTVFGHKEQLSSQTG
jgi:hypothetical protein